MIEELYIIGQDGRRLDLLNDEHFVLTAFDGLTEVDADLATMALAHVDGDEITNTRATARPLYIEMQCKSGYSVERMKRHILSVCKHKSEITCRHTNDGRTLEISGIVKAISLPRVTDGPHGRLGLTVQSGSAYWQDKETQAVIISRVKNTHHFPLAFPEPQPLGVYDLNMVQTYTNDGDTDTGLIIRIIALGNVKNPVIRKAGGGFIGVNAELKSGDEVIISTETGAKYITINGVNAFNKILAGSEFLRLNTGDNEFAITAEEGAGACYFTLSFKRRFV